MTCERIEELLSAYLEGELSAGERGEIETHLADCPACAELLEVMRESLGAMAGFPEIEPGRELMASLYAIPQRKSRFRAILDFFQQPALQPVYAAFTILFLFLSFVLVAPQGRPIRKALDRQVHAAYGEVEKLYARAGSLTDDLGQLKNGVVNSIKTLNPSKGREEKP